MWKHQFQIWSFSQLLPSVHVKVTRWFTLALTFLSHVSYHPPPALSLSLFHTHTPLTKIPTQYAALASPILTHEALNIHTHSSYLPNTRTHTQFHIIRWYSSLSLSFPLVCGLPPSHKPLLQPPTLLPLLYSQHIKRWNSTKRNQVANLRYKGSTIVNYVSSVVM